MPPPYSLNWPLLLSILHWAPSQIIHIPNHIPISLNPCNWYQPPPARWFSSVGWYCPMWTVPVDSPLVVLAMASTQLCQYTVVLATASQYCRFESYMVPWMHRHEGTWMCGSNPTVNCWLVLPHVDGTKYHGYVNMMWPKCMDTGSTTTRTPLAYTPYVACTM